MNPDPVWSTVNWVHLSKGEALSVQRLGVRYRLHPLVVEDLAYKEDRAKIDKYKTHMLITIPFISYRKYDDSLYHVLFKNRNKKRNVHQDVDDAPLLSQIVSTYSYVRRITP